MQRSSNRYRSERGFTLIEVLIAGMILVIAAVAMAAAMAQAPGLNERPREERAARSGIRAVLSELAATPFGQVALNYHNRGFAVPPLRPAPGDPDGLPGEVQFAYGPGGDTTFYTVTVRVRWKGMQGVRVVESTQLLANVRGDTEDPPPLENIEGGGATVPPGTNDPSQQLALTSTTLASN